MSDDDATSAMMMPSSPSDDISAYNSLSTLSNLVISPTSSKEACISLCPPRWKSPSSWNLTTKTKTIEVIDFNWAIANEEVKKCKHYEEEMNKSNDKGSSQTVKTQVITILFQPEDRTMWVPRMQKNSLCHGRCLVDDWQVDSMFDGRGTNCLKYVWAISKKASVAIKVDCKSIQAMLWICRGRLSNTDENEGTWGWMDDTPTNRSKWSNLLYRYWWALILYGTVLCHAC